MVLSKIEMSPEDIALGIRNVGCACPVYRAIGRAFPTLKFTVSYAEVLSLTTRNSSDRPIAQLPFEARQFISAFDDGKTVQPITFALLISV